MKRLTLTLTLTFIFLFIFALSGIAIAKKNSELTPEKSYPTGCQTIGYQFVHGLLTLTPVTEEHPQAVFFIHNASNKDVKLLQVRDGKEPYTMYNNISISPNQWAVYATDEQLTKFICLNNSKEITAGAILDCKDLLKICEFPKVVFSLNNRGNYWATTNRPMNEAVRAIIRQGVLLKWW